MIGCGGAQADSGFFSWKSWEDGEAMNRNEKVNRKNLFRTETEKFSLGHRGSGLIQKHIQGKILKPQLEIQTWNSRARSVELKCRNYLMILMREDRIFKFWTEMVGYFPISYGHPSCDGIHKLNKTKSAIIW